MKNVGNKSVKISSVMITLILSLYASTAYADGTGSGGDSNIATPKSEFKDEAGKFENTLQATAGVSTGAGGPAQSAGGGGISAHYQDSQNFVKGHIELGKRADMVTMKSEFSLGLMPEEFSGKVGIAGGAVRADIQPTLSHIVPAFIGVYLRPNEKTKLTLNGGAGFTKVPGVETKEDTLSWTAKVDAEVDVSKAVRLTGSAEVGQSGAANFSIEQIAAMIKFNPSSTGVQYYVKPEAQFVQSKAKGVSGLGLDEKEKHVSNLFLNAGIAF